ncbi:hypothetical protein BDV18DRAFT_156031 [Aspergillus unguis]
MAHSTTTRIRVALENLRNKVLDPDLEKRLLPDNTIPDDFLKQHKINLYPYTFPADPTDKHNLSMTPPVLFRPRSAKVMEDHPIDEQQYHSDNLVRESELLFEDYNPAQGDQGLSKWSPLERGRWLSSYLINWALGKFPRKLPPDTMDLGELCGIEPVTYESPIVPYIN